MSTISFSYCHCRVIAAAMAQRCTAALWKLWGWQLGSICVARAVSGINSPLLYLHNENTSEVTAQHTRKGLNSRGKKRHHKDKDSVSTPQFGHGKVQTQGKIPVVGMKQEMPRLHSGPVMTPELLGFPFVLHLSTLKPAFLFFIHTAFCFIRCLWPYYSIQFWITIIKGSW